MLVILLERWTMEGDSPVSSTTSIEAVEARSTVFLDWCWNPRCVPRKAKYATKTDSEQVAWAKDEKYSGKRVISSWNRGQWTSGNTIGLRQYAQCRPSTFDLVLSLCWCVGLRTWLDLSAYRFERSESRLVVWDHDSSLKLLCATNYCNCPKSFDVCWSEFIQLVGIEGVERLLVIRLETRTKESHMRARWSVLNC